MLKNYFKIAIAVLRRRKFFTFISLFGISFTLTILIVLTAFIDNLTSANYPEVNRDRSLYINFVQQEKTKTMGTWTGPASYDFLNRYAGSLKSASAVAISTMFSPTNTYVNNKKLALNMKFTNDQFWQVLQFDFLEGKAYSKTQIDNGERVAVISEETKKNYFGDVASVVGQHIEADNVKYRVIGVVKSVPVTMVMSYADLYVPYTVSKADFRSKKIHGSYTAIMMGESKADLPRIQSEYASVISKVKPEEGFDKLSSIADDYVTGFTRQMFGDGRESGTDMLIAIVSVFVVFFMLLPTLNLININTSRIMERSSEIGVRKAFGASSGSLVLQFITENLILTFLGVLIAFILSFGVLQWINTSGMIANIELTINYTVFGYSLLACLVFGLLSGVYPAWRMSRMHVVNALKAK